jgi:hypothetical protein
MNKTVKILWSDSLDGLENKIGHAIDEGWDLAGHIQQCRKTFMFYILVMKQ